MTLYWLQNFQKLINGIILSILLFVSTYASAREWVSTQAMPRMQNYEWMSMSQWYQFHADDIERASQGDVEVVFLGDSITESWTWNEESQGYFQEYFGAYRTANFGVGGDQTQNVLWRLQHGLHVSLDPDLVVLMIGTNNLLLGQQAPEEVFAGIQAVVRQILENYTAARVLLMGVTPADQNPGTANREKVSQLNEKLGAENFGERVKYYDFGGVFLDKNGKIPQELMYDYLHPTPKGLKLWGNKISLVVHQLMKAARKERLKMPAHSEKIQVMGRSAAQADGSLLIGYPGVSLSMTVKAKKLEMLANSSAGKSWVEVFIDGASVKKIELPSVATKFTLFESEKAKEHKVTIVHNSETWHGGTTIKQFIAYDGAWKTPPKLPSRKLLVVGDSITCGDAVIQPESGSCEKDYSWWNASSTYGFLLAERFNAQVHLACYGGRGIYRTWEGDTEALTGSDIFDLAFAESEKKYSWDHNQYEPDAVIVNLGTNDFSTHAGALPEESIFVGAYVELLNKIIRTFPKKAIFLTEGPMVSDGAENGQQKSRLRRYLEETQKAVGSENVHLMFSSVQGGGRCDGHPDASVHRKMADGFAETISKTLGWP